MNKVARAIAINALLMYRRSLSPDHGALRRLRGGQRFCRLEPTCSTMALRELSSASESGVAMRAILDQLKRCHSGLPIRPEEDEPGGRHRDEGSSKQHRPSRC
jgi:putative component of membrane protein insertase Oxa1/YidC/SpoIIIJ protein YidD